MVAGILPEESPSSTGQGAG